MKKQNRILVGFFLGLIPLIFSAQEAQAQGCTCTIPGGSCGYKATTPCVGSPCGGFSGSQIVISGTCSCDTGWCSGLTALACCGSVIDPTPTPTSAPAPTSPPGPTSPPPLYECKSCVCGSCQKIKQSYPCTDGCSSSADCPLTDCDKLCESLGRYPGVPYSCRSKCEEDEYDAGEALCRAGDAGFICLPSNRCCCENRFTNCPAACAAQGLEDGTCRNWVWFDLPPYSKSCQAGETGVGGGKPVGCGGEEICCCQQTCNNLCQNQGYLSGSCRTERFELERVCFRNGEIDIGQDNCAVNEKCCCVPTSTPTPGPCTPPLGPALNTVDQSCQTSGTYVRNFSWATPAGTQPFSYRFEISEDAGYANPTPIEAGTNKQVSNVSLKTGTTYYWRVRAENACGCYYGTEYNTSTGYTKPCTGWVAPTPTPTPIPVPTSTPIPTPTPTPIPCSWPNSCTLILFCPSSRRTSGECGLGQVCCLPAYAPTPTPTPTPAPCSLPNYCTLTLLCPSSRQTSGTCPLLQVCCRR